MGLSGVTPGVNIAPLMERAVAEECGRDAARKPFTDHLLELPRAARAFCGRQLALSWRSALVLLALVLLGLGLRLPGMSRPPQLYFEALYQDERKIVDNTLSVMRGKNIAEHYPLALYYWLEPQFRLAKLVTFWLEDVPRNRWRQRDADFVAYVDANPLPFYVLARANMLLFSMAISVVLFMLARQLAGLAAALVVCALSAATPLLVIYAKMAYYDLPMTFWFVITVGALAWTYKHRAISGVYWSAALLAWAFCWKQNAIVLAPLWVFTAVAVGAGERPWWGGLASRHVWLAALLGVAVVAWAYPALIDREALEQFFALVRNRYYAGPSDSVPRNWFTWVGVFWVRNAHMLVLALFASGLGLLIGRSKDRVLAIFVLVATLLYFIIAGASRHAIDRTMLPLLPGLLLGMTGWQLWIEQKPMKPRVKRTVLGLAVGLPFISLSYNAIRYDLLITCKDTRELALAWLEENVPTGSRIAQETYGPLLPSAKKGSYLLRGDRSGKPVYIVRHYVRLTDLDPAGHRREKTDYMVMSRSHLPDPEAYAEKVTWQPDRSYRKLEKEFPTLAAFEERGPFTGLRSAWFRDGRIEPRWGRFFDFRIINFWRNHDSFVLGPPVSIHLVSGINAALSSP
jgi:hypothetical protein